MLQRLPIVIKNLLILNALFYIAIYVLFKNTFGMQLLNLLALHFPTVAQFKPWQFITYMFLHGDFMHLFFNMLALFMFGVELEGIWGPKKFLQFYVISGLGGALLHIIITYFSYSAQGIPFEYAPPMIGASGAVFGILAAFGFTFPNREIFSLMIPIPIKAKYWVMIYGLIELFYGVRAQDNIAHYAHLGGMFAGIAVLFFWKYKDR